MGNQDANKQPVSLDRLIHEIDKDKDFVQDTRLTTKVREFVYIHPSTTSLLAGLAYYSLTWSIVSHTDLLPLSAKLLGHCYLIMPDIFHLFQSGAPAEDKMDLLVDLYQDGFFSKICVGFESLLVTYITAGVLENKIVVAHPHSGVDHKVMPLEEKGQKPPQRASPKRRGSTLLAPVYDYYATPCIGLSGNNASWLTKLLAGDFPVVHKMYREQQELGYPFVKASINLKSFLLWSHLIKYRDVEEVLRVYDAAIQNNPNWFDMQETNADIFHINYYLKISVPDDPRSYLINAAHKFMRKQFFGAYMEWEELLGVCDDNPKVLLRFLQTYYRIKQLSAKAEKLYHERAVNVAERLYHSIEFDGVDNVDMNSFSESKNQVFSIGDGVILKRYQDFSHLRRELKMNKLLMLLGISTPETYFYNVDSESGSLVQLMSYEAGTTLAKKIEAGHDISIDLTHIILTLAKIHALLPLHIQGLSERHYGEYLQQSISQSPFGQITGDVTEDEKSFLELVIENYSPVVDALYQAPKAYCKDAHPGNWIITDDGRVISIDNEVTRIAPIQIDLVNLLEIGVEVPPDIKKNLITQYIAEYNSLSTQSKDGQQKKVSLAYDEEFQLQYEQALIQRSLELVRYYSSPQKREIGIRLLSKSIAIIDGHLETENSSVAGSTAHEYYLMHRSQYESLRGGMKKMVSVLENTG